MVVGCLVFVVLALVVPCCWLSCVGCWSLFIVCCLLFVV